MRESLLLISVIILLAGGCKSRNTGEGNREADSLNNAISAAAGDTSGYNINEAGEVVSPNSSDTSFSPKGTSKDKAVEIIHKSPEQEKIDSIKQAKQKLKN